MSFSPLVSICCATYNHEAYIRAAIDGFLAQQTDFEFEIIIYDDASSDKTPSIIIEYAKICPQIIPIMQPTNQFSKGINPFPQYIYPRAAGKYIANCEGDDCWTDPFKLQKQVEFLEANPEYGMISSDISLIDKNGHLIPDNRMLSHQREMYKSEVSIFNLIECNVINTPTTCIRTNIIMSLLERIETESLWYIYDYWFWLQIAVDHKIKVTEEKTATYRVHSQGMSKQKGFLLKRAPYSLYDASMEILNRRRICSRYEQRIIAACIFRLIKNKVLGARRKCNLIWILFNNPSLILLYFTKQDREY